MGTPAILSDPAWIASIAAAVSAVVNVVQLFQNIKLKDKVQSLSASGAGNIAQNTSDNSTAVAHARDVTVNHGSKDK